jgi:hypothetical protein
MLRQAKTRRYERRTERRWAPHQCNLDVLQRAAVHAARIKVNFEINKSWAANQQLGHIDYA